MWQKMVDKNNMSTNGNMDKQQTMIGWESGVNEPIIWWRGKWKVEIAVTITSTNRRGRQIWKEPEKTEDWGEHGKQKENTRRRLSTRHLILTVLKWQVRCKMLSIHHHQIPLNNMYLLFPLQFFIHISFYSFGNTFTKKTKTKHNTHIQSNTVYTYCTD